MSYLELTKGCCGCPIRNTVCTGLVFSFVHGVFVVCFVFTNTAYPPFYYVDYMFGGCGAGLVVLSILTMCVVDVKKAQFIRGFFGFSMVMTILATAVTNYYYTIERWNDVIVTAFARRRKDFVRNLPDEFWMACAILSCIAVTFLTIYTPYICSFMCRPWKSHLFTSDYRNNRATSALPPETTFRTDIPPGSTLPTYTQINTPRPDTPHPVQES